MPSGAKKRKAARKKKEKETNSTSPSSTDNNNTHGHDDPKSQDERDSDGGEVGSPASQDHQNHHHPFSEGDQESEKRDTSPLQSFVSESNSMEEIPKKAESTEILGQHDDVVVKIERQLDDEDLDRRDVSIKHVEHDRSSSSSSSDDESQASEKKLEETHDSTSKPISNSDEGKPANSQHEDVSETAFVGEVDNDTISAAETAFVGKVVEPILSTPEEVNPVIESSSINNSVVSEDVELRLKENEEKLLPKSNGVNGVQSEGNEGKMLPPSSGLTGETSTVVENIQDSEIPGEKQALVASTPPVVRRTSWLSCCGLFDVLSGSGS
ncbi:hypothetical protein SLE2022_388130 [Rubroshorea leprosula]